jgi:hypothetical protein
MSEVHVETRPPTFLDLYDQGKVADRDVDDFVSRWHADQEPWAKDLSLHEYLGMTHEEYEVWLCDPLSLPSILTARRSGRALVDVMRDRYEAMRGTARRSDAAILHSLGHWLEQRHH